MENSKEITAYIREVNTLISSTVKGAEYVNLGPQYSTMSYPDVAESLILHRMSKKWEEPSDRGAEARRKASVDSVFKYDLEGLVKFDPVELSLDPFVRSQLYKTRLAIHEALQSYRFRPENLRMPSGETVKSAAGDVSIVAKLRDPKQWCVTADCFELAATVIYRVPALKACARKLIGVVSREQTRCLYFAFGDRRDVGFMVFRELLLDVVTIVDGSRVETVPKSTESDRVISCEPMLNMIVQSIIEEGLREVIAKQFDIDLQTSQDLHKALISDLSNATIDLKNASNSNWMATIKWLYPNWFVKQLEQSRSPVGKFDGSTHEWNMIAPMGNGFTFGLMTFTLLCAARQFDSFAHVFGDDIIIDADCSSAYIELLEVLGYSINTEKTFLSGPFRESCGGFIYDGDYLSSYEFTWATNVVEANVLVNKVRKLASLNDIPWLRRLSRNLMSVVPSLCKRWAPDLEVIGDFVIYTSHSQFTKLREDPSYNHVRRSFLERKAIVRDLKHRQLDVRNLAVGYRSKIQSDSYRSKPLDNVHPHWAAYYLFSGRCSAPTRRNNDTVNCELEFYEVAKPFPTTEIGGVKLREGNLRNERWLATITLYKENYLKGTIS